MFSPNRVFFALGVTVVMTWTATLCVAAPHNHEFTEEESQKLAEVLAGSPRFEFPDAELPVDENQTCKPPAIGNPGDCAPGLAVKPKVEAVREAKRQAPPAPLKDIEKNAEQRKL